MYVCMCVYADSHCAQKIVLWRIITKEKEISIKRVSKEKERKTHTKKHQRKNKHTVRERVRLTHREKKKEREKELPTSPPYTHNSAAQRLF